MKATKQIDVKARRQFGRWRLEFRGDDGGWLIVSLHLPGLSYSNARAVADKLARQISAIPMRERTRDRVRAELGDYREQTR